MIQWEYTIEVRPPIAEEKWLNDLGVNGWELVTVIESSFSKEKIYYFKRPLPQPSPYDLFTPSQKQPS